MVEMGLTCDLASGSIITRKIKDVRSVNINGGGSAIATGVHAGFKAPLTGHITEAEVLSVNNVSGSIALAVWIKAYSGGVPTNSDEVDIFSLSSATQSQETGLTIDVNFGDQIVINVDSCTDCTLVSLGLTFEVA